MKIGFCSLDWSNIVGADGYPVPGGAGWYRCVLPAKMLESKGIHAVYGPFLYGDQQGAICLREWGPEPGGEGGKEHDDCDILVIQRWMGPIAAKIIYIARAAGQIIVNDLDDWFEGLPPKNPAFRYSHPHYGIPRSVFRAMSPEQRAQHTLLDNRNNFRSAIAASSHLTVSTPFLRERYHKMFPDLPITVIPNAIDLARWEQRDVTRRLTLGWVGATFNRSGDLEVIGEPLSRFLQDNKAGFFHGGADNVNMEGATPLGLDLSAVRYKSLPMVSIEKYPAFFRQFNVGVVPLTMVPFNFAKSNIKGIEMSAAGIPFVASPTPAYRELYGRGAGLTAEKPKDWLKRLNSLRDPDYRRELGAAGRAVVAEHYDIERNYINWGNAYKEMNP